MVLWSIFLLTEMNDLSADVTHKCPFPSLYISSDQVTLHVQGDQTS